jgi:hypothetical protein
VPFDPDKLCAFLEEDKRHNPSNYAIFTISEGAQMLGGSIIEKGPEDAYGHRKLGGVGVLLEEYIKEKIGVHTVYQQAAYLMRSGEPDALDRMVAFSYAYMASDMVFRKEFGRMVALKDGGIPPFYRDTQGEAMTEELYDIEHYRRRLPTWWVNRCPVIVTDVGGFRVHPPGMIAAAPGGGGFPEVRLPRAFVAVSHIHRPTTEEPPCRFVACRSSCSGSSPRSSSAEAQLMASFWAASLHMPTGSRQYRIITVNNHERSLTSMFLDDCTNAGCRLHGAMVAGPRRPCNGLLPYSNSRVANVGLSAGTSLFPWRTAGVPAMATATRANTASIPRKSSSPDTLPADISP